MRTSTKLIITSTMISTLVVMTLAVYSLNHFYTENLRQEHELLEKSIRTFWVLFRREGAEFRLADGRLLAGERVVNGDFRIPDKVQEIFGGVATVFMGDVRVSTNVLNDKGERAVGTRLVGPAYDAIFRERKPYRGEASILGQPYLTAYDPIRSRSGDIIGALFVGVKISTFQEKINQVRTPILCMLAVLMASMTFVTFLLVRITRKLEDADTNNLNFLRTLIDTIPCPIFYKDSKGCYLGFNKAFEAYVGRPPEELVGKTPFELWPRDLAERFQQQDQALFDSPGTQIYEGSAAYADGTRHDVVFHKATFLSQSGEVAGLVGVMLDISERKRIEAELRFRNLMVATQQETSLDGILAVDRHANIISYNTRFMDLMHIPREMLDAGNDTPVLSRAMERAEAPQDFYEKICRIYDKPFDTSRDEVVLKGGVIIDRYSAPMIDRDGGYCGRVWYFRDITEKKHADEVHLRFEAERHHSRMMELFIARLGHDLKTPITPVMALMPIVKTRVSDPELSRMLDICYQSVVNIRELTDKACKFVKLSSPPPESLTRVCLAGIVTEVLAENKPDLDQKGMDSILAIDPGLKVMAVSGQLRELFRNLITNAVRFSAEGGTISVSAQQTEHGISVAVRDNGAGIDPESLEHIFDEFYKADESRHNLDFPGLGLAICRKIVTNHHGRIWAESRGLGSGTTIHIALPRFE